MLGRSIWRMFPGGFYWFSVLLCVVACRTSTISFFCWQLWNIPSPFLSKRSRTHQGTFKDPPFPGGVALGIWPPDSLGYYALSYRLLLLQCQGAVGAPGLEILECLRCVRICWWVFCPLGRPVPWLWFSLTSRARASRVAEVSRFKKCSAIGCYRIQKQVLPIGAPADFHHLCGTCELLSQILAPFFHFPFISFFSSQLLSTRVGSLHLSCTCPISSQPCRSERDFVLQSLHKVLPSTTSYNKACTKYFPVLLRTTKLAQSTSQYFFVLQSLRKILSSTTSYYKACTKYFQVLLRTTKLAQSTSQYYFVLQDSHKVLPSTTSY